MAERYGHKQVVRQGDEYVCSACGKRWDDTDERNGEIPQCVRIVTEKYASQSRR